MAGATDRITNGARLATVGRSLHAATFVVDVSGRSG